MSSNSTSKVHLDQPTKTVSIVSRSPRWPQASPIWQHASPHKRLLIAYLESKVHPALKNRKLETITVKGSYKRDAPAIISSTENPSRGFNWQRPTAEVTDEFTVLLHCFPGLDYVQHYASLISTYFSILPGVHERTPSVRLDPPLADASSHLFHLSNIIDIGQADVIIIGYLDICPTRVIERKIPFIEAKIPQDGPMFSWTKFKTIGGYNVAYLGCAISLWGELVGKLVQILKQVSQMKCVLYIGRVGSLDPDLIPNEVLATGRKCNIDDEKVHWNNVLSGAASSSQIVHHGDLVTVPSPLCEDHVWFERWAKECRWVDCETAYIARAAISNDIDFGYLHIVSDNLGLEYADSLANEDNKDIQAKRSILFGEIDRILRRFLESYT